MLQSLLAIDPSYKPIESIRESLLSPTDQETCKPSREVCKSSYFFRTGGNMAFLWH